MLYRSRALREAFMTPRKAFQILGVLPSSSSPASVAAAAASSHLLRRMTPASVKKAYIAQTLRCHPDLFPEDPNANEKFKELGEALRVALQAVTTAKKRDRCGGSGSQQGAHRDRDGLGDGHEGDAASSGWSRAEDDVLTADMALASLRRAIVVYETHKLRDRFRIPSGGGASGKVVGQSGGHKQEGEGERDSTSTHDTPFFTPSLEHIRQVCHSETAARHEVMTFCDTVPRLLCGPAALFESIAFFHTRYIALTAACMQRFAKNLPIIVNRVVRRRKMAKWHQSNSTSLRQTRSHTGVTQGAVTAAAAGVGTGNRPATQRRLEDMAMKPLVLMGALIFDSTAPASDKQQQQHKEEEEEEEGMDSERSSTYPGVLFPSEVKVCPELRCVIRPSDTIGDIVSNMAQWERESFERLKLELALSDVASLMADLLNSSSSHVTTNTPGSRSGVCLTVRPHLEASHAHLLEVLLMAQHLVRDLLGGVEEQLDHVFKDDAIVTHVLQEKEEGTTHYASSRVSRRQRAKEEDERSTKDETQASSGASNAGEKKEGARERADRVPLSSSDFCGTWWWWRTSSPSHGAAGRGTPTTAKPPSPSSPSHGNEATDDEAFLSDFIAICRRLSAMAAPYIRGNILIEWPEAYRHSATTTTTSSSSSAVQQQPGAMDASQFAAGPQGGAFKPSSQAPPTAGTGVNSGIHSKVGDRSGAKWSSEQVVMVPYLVARHPTCCVAEDIAFSVSLHLSRSPLAFLRGWYAALAEVLYQVHVARTTIPSLIACRDAVTAEEFIKETQKKEEKEEETPQQEAGEGLAPCSRPVRDDNKDNAAAPGDDGATYRYRGPIFIFPRLFNMSPRRELLFWRQVHRHREYLAEHSRVMSPINVFFNCSPYDPSHDSHPFSAQHYVHSKAAAAQQEQTRCGGGESMAFSSSASKGIDDPTAGSDNETAPPSDDAAAGGEDDMDLGLDAGWVGSAKAAPMGRETDGGGSGSSGEAQEEAAVLSLRTLVHPQRFRCWLEDVVEHSSLQREIHRVLEAAGVGYMIRDPQLPLANFLSFVQVFCAAAAVRGVLEGGEPPSSSLRTSPRQATLTPDDVGLTIIVGTHCDVRDGGRLYVPWTMDPNLLVALLGEEEEDVGKETAFPLAGRNTSIYPHPHRMPCSGARPCSFVIVVFVLGGLGGLHVSHDVGKSSQITT
eukprot:gene7490-5277_t